MTVSAIGNKVAAVRLGPSYRGTCCEVGSGIERLGAELGWADPTYGCFGRVIPEGARVLVKPNWVLHQNQGPWGLEPLITHPSVVRATVENLLKSRAGSVQLGDAPIQSCDFPRLLQATGLDTWSGLLSAANRRFLGICDFRRTICKINDGVRNAAEGIRSLDNYVLFDLGPSSLLEPITPRPGAFRVTQYSPTELARTHTNGRHQYLIAREALAADVVVNLPKLKTHKKSGITCALKNLVGVNGNKEFLPHHRVGGSRVGGDCYPGGNPVKRFLEHILDRANSTASKRVARVWLGLAGQLQHALKIMGDSVDVEGSWYGNDTIWRTALDLNRILLYGRIDGTMSDRPQRQILHVVDAVVAGQGDGPLASEPLPLGLLMAGECAAAVDFIGAHLLGYEPDRVPIVREAFGGFVWPLVNFSSGEVRVCGDFGQGRPEQMLIDVINEFSVKHPIGWRAAARAGVIYCDFLCKEAAEV